MIDTQDFLRYNRPMSIKEVGIEGQLKIKNARVLLIGAGALGSAVALYLAASGVGTLGLIDYDHVEIHNLHRQILFTEQDLDKPKVQVIKERLKKTNAHIKIQTYQAKLSCENSHAIIQNYDYIVDGSDNFKTRYLVNDTCVALGKSLIYGSILGFQGQLAVFNHNASKNLRDLFPQAPDASQVPNCNLNGVLGPLPGIIGTMMAQETLKAILNLPILSNKLLCLNSLQWDQVVVSY